MNNFLGFTLLVALFGVVTSNQVRSVFDPSKMKSFTMPESCKSKGMEFCFENDNYPLDIVEELLKDVTKLEIASEEGVIGDREGSTTDENDCSTLSRSDPIYYIVDESGKDRVVVQMEDRFQQRFSVMWCDQEGQMTTSTQHFMKSTVQSYKMSCKNKYMNYDFLVLSSRPDHNGNWKMERARTKTGIPVCCSCRYEKN